MCTHVWHYIGQKIIWHYTGLMYLQYSDNTEPFFIVYRVCSIDSEKLFFSNLYFFQGIIKNELHSDIVMFHYMGKELYALQKRRAEELTTKRRQIQTKK